MKLTNVRKLDDINRLLQDKNYQEALSILQSMESSEFIGEEYATFCLMISEARLWLGDYDIEDVLSKALQYFKDSHNNEMFARAKYLYGCLLVALGKHGAAREVLLESYLNFKRCDNYNAVSRVLNRLALVQFQIGAVDDAIANLDRCLEINKKLNRPDRIQAILRNSALIKFMSGRFKEAIDIYRSNRSLISSGPDGSVCRFYLTYAMATALQGNSKNALSLISKAQALLGDLKREKAQYYEYLGWIYNVDGRFKEAVKALKIGIKLSNEIAPESALISQSKRLLADTYIGLKEFKKAQKTASEALAVAEKIGEQVEIAGCYRVFARVAVESGMKSKARDYFKKACEIYDRIESRYELAVTRYQMATVRLFGKGENTAYLYLAREYFAAENVKNYISLVNSAIKNDGRSPFIVTTDNDEEFDGPFIAVHPKTKQIVELAESIAESDIPILLTGPTGCSKDRLAHYIHNFSGRKGKFVPVNSAAIPDGMVESELFGYCRGAFTGADHNRIGLFEEADGGTLYLNEIGDSTEAFQAKLLEVLESKTIRRLGSNEKKKISVRIIAATNHDLDRRRRDGKFRDDLYHRLNGMPIELPPLSQRIDDIPELVKYFLVQRGLNLTANGNGEAVRSIGKLLSKRTWPGNVRELQSEIKRLYLMTGGDVEEMVVKLGEQVRDKRQVLIETLEKTGWNRSETARQMGKTEGTIRNWIKKYNIVDPTRN
jgi:DNA-binding NtrC family response regulator